MKMKKLNLTSGWPDRNSQNSDMYRVEKAIDTVEYTPGQFLHKQEVEMLCAAKGWNVTIVKMEK